MSEPGDTVEADEAIRPGLEKSPDAFRTISEVSQALDVPQHVLRFWEGKFAQIRPLKRGGGRRYYRPDDVDLLRGIQSLLYGDGYTIKGVQKLLRENGAKFVIAAGRRRAEPAKAKVAAVPRAAPAPQPEPVEAPPRRPPGPVKAPPAQPVVPISTPDVVEAIPGMPAPVLPPAKPEPEPTAQTEGGLAPLTAAARREAAARLLSHLKAMRRDYDLGLQAAKNGRTR